MPSDLKKRIAAIRSATDFTDPISVLDIGANPMRHDAPYKHLHLAGEVNVTGFDPQSDTLEGLIGSGAAGDRYLPYAIGDGADHDLNVYRGNGLSSLLQLRAKTLDFLGGLKRAGRLVSKHEFSTKRLDELDEIEHVDLFKIDVQGAEVMIFENGQRKLRSAVTVHTEISFFPLYNEQPTFGDVDRSLRDAGFLPHSFYNVVRRHVRSRFLRRVARQPQQHILDGDIIYFRDLSNSDLLSARQLARMALIADGVYGFFDYALRCLDVLEQRKEADPKHIEQYIKYLQKA